LEDWTIFPLKREIVPLQAEMLHPTKSSYEIATLKKHQMKFFIQFSTYKERSKAFRRRNGKDSERY
jgi:hypothetical protein